MKWKWIATRHLLCCWYLFKSLEIKFDRNSFGNLVVHVTHLLFSNGKQTAKFEIVPTNNEKKRKQNQFAHCRKNQERIEVSCIQPSSQIYIGIFVHTHSKVTPSHIIVNVENEMRISLGLNSCRLQWQHHKAAHIHIHTHTHTCGCSWECVSPATHLQEH